MKIDSYIISTERLGLRRWLESDIKPFAKMNNDKAVMKYYPKTLTDEETLEMIQRINLRFEKSNFGQFAVENKLTGQFIGYTGFAIPTFDSFFTPCVEIGWRFMKDSWGHGFATEAAIACLRYGFDTLKFDKIFSFTSIINKKSENVMRRIGMKHIANFDHPKIEKNNILCPHVLYRIKNAKIQLK